MKDGAIHVGEASPKRLKKIILYMSFCLLFIYLIVCILYLLCKINYVI